MHAIPTPRLKLYVINLARRPDRRAAMARKMRRLGLRFETIAAIDAATTAPHWIAQYFTPKGPLGVLPKGDQCCSLSHRKAWNTFLASKAPYGAFFEDDVVLDNAATGLLSDLSWLPSGCDVVKLEHFGPESQRVLVGPAQAINRGRSIAPILSRHAGAAAYILSRRAAETLLRQQRWSVPVDHLLFNPNVSPLAEALHPVQMLPAIARQEAACGSDIRAFRLADRQFSLKLVRREIVRAYYELRLLPRQIAAVLSGKAHLVRVGADMRQNRSGETPALLTRTEAAGHQV